MPNPPAALVAAVRLAPDTQPMPVCTIGSRQPTSSQNRVRSGSGAEPDGPSDMVGSVRAGPAPSQRRRLDRRPARVELEWLSVGLVDFGI